jgi:hypothetical protein
VGVRAWAGPRPDQRHKRMGPLDQFWDKSGKTSNLMYRHGSISLKGAREMMRQNGARTQVV